ncbi:hypothetical protein BTI_5784 [Burkholderia thailandensis MSMB121]|nr:hypothetical protein BTI_5784 [Burkholderia thailandensis MSMB121]
MRTRKRGRPSACTIATKARPRNPTSGSDAEAEPRQAGREEGVQSPFSPIVLQKGIVMKANVIFAVALAVLSGTAMAVGPTTSSQTQSVTGGASGSVLIGSGSYTSNSTSVAGSAANSTATPTGSTATASAMHDSTSTASGSGKNGGAFAAGGGIGVAGASGATADTGANADALSGGVTATIVLGAKRYTATTANDQGSANADAIALTGKQGSATLAGAQHTNTSAANSTGYAGSPSASGGSQGDANAISSSQ